MKFASVLLAVGCLLSAVHATWLETTIFLPDSFSGLMNPRMVEYNSTNNTIYVGSWYADFQNRRRLRRTYQTERSSMNSSTARGVADGS